jgi:hypothetical protein
MLTILDEIDDFSNKVILYDILITLFSILGGALIFLLIFYAVRAPGKKLNKIFVSLGTLKGLSYASIVAAAGAPNAISSTTAKDGTPLKVCQWITTGYHIVLLFDPSDTCLGVSSEVSV